MKQTLQELLEAVEDLGKRVTDLGTKYEVHEDQTRTMKWLLGICIGAVVLCLSLVGFSFYLWTQLDDAVDKAELSISQNRANAVTNCDNANESRAANRVLWDYIINLSVARNDGEESTPEQTKMLEDFRQWIAKLFEERDCDDLARKYPIPDPPVLSRE